MTTKDTTSPEIRQDGNVESRTIEPSSKRQVSVVAQSLDNQWVPKQLLKKVLHKGLTLKKIGKNLESIARTEYLRALINARQVIINRAYLYNTPIVFRDYLDKGGDRKAFKSLLDSGVIVPFFLTESSPIQPPPFSTISFDAWKKICEEVRPHCLRLA